MVHSGCTMLTRGTYPILVQNDEIPNMDVIHLGPPGHGRHSDRVCRDNKIPIVMFFTSKVDDLALASVVPRGVGHHRPLTDSVPPRPCGRRTEYGEPTVTRGGGPWLRSRCDRGDATRNAPTRWKGGRPRATPFQTVRTGRNARPRRADHRRVLRLADPAAAARQVQVPEARQCSSAPTTAARWPPSRGDP